MNSASQRWQSEDDWWNQPVQLRQTNKSAIVQLRLTLRLTGRISDIYIIDGNSHQTDSNQLKQLKQHREQQDHRSFHNCPISDPTSFNDESLKKLVCARIISPLKEECSTFPGGWWIFCSPFLLYLGNLILCVIDIRRIAKPVSSNKRHFVRLFYPGVERLRDPPGQVESNSDHSI